MSIYFNIDRSAGSAAVGSKPSSEKSSSLKAILALENISDEDRTAAVAKALASFLIKEKDSIPLDKPLESLGMDSLVAMEMRNWIRQQVGIETSTITILQSPSLLSLGKEVRLAIAHRAGSYDSKATKQ